MCVCLTVYLLAYLPDCLFVESCVLVFFPAHKLLACVFFQTFVRYVVGFLYVSLHHVIILACLTACRSVSDYICTACCMHLVFLSKYGSY